jgi:REP element-mobilizing transposase RayT
MAATRMAGSAATSLDHRHPGNRVLRKGRVSLPGRVYLVTTVTRGREHVFADFAAGCAAARCFEDARVLGDACMMAWVLMPDHAHWLIGLGEGHTLATVVNRLKPASARNVNHCGIAVVRCGHAPSMTTPCVPRKMCGAAHVTWSPTLCVQDW